MPGFGKGTGQRAAPVRRMLVWCLGQGPLAQRVGADKAQKIMTAAAIDPDGPG